jgi:hypothetical protein
MAVDAESCGDLIVIQSPLLCLQQPQNVVFYGHPDLVISSDVRGRLRLKPPAIVCGPDLVAR